MILIEVWFWSNEVIVILVKNQIDIGAFEDMADLSVWAKPMPRPLQVAHGFNVYILEQKLNSRIKP